MRDVRYNLRVHAPSTANGAVGYEGYFGLQQMPFSLAPDTRFLFQSESHRAALSQVKYALERREPIMVVTGEIGTGKTLLCRTVLEQLERKTFVATVDDPRLDSDDLLKRMLRDFGVVSKDRTTWTPTTRHDLVHALQEFLASLAPLDAHAAVIIDEAQHLRPDVLEDLRLIANVQNERGTLLQLILIGQQGLDALLAQPELRQLQQRVSRYVRLERLSASEVADYIDHRMAVARQGQVQSTFPGANELQREIAEWQAADAGSTFTPEAVRAIVRLSQGIPRVVNLLCDRALEAAFAGQSRTVDEPLITAAAHSLGLPSVTGGEFSMPATVSPNDGTAIVSSPATAEASTPNAARGRRYALVAGAVVVALAAAWFGQQKLSELAGRGPDPQAQGTVQPADATPPAPVAVPPPSSATAASTTAPAPRTSAPSAPATAVPPTPATSAPSAPAGSASPAAQTSAPSPAGDAFEIVVASFRTAARANDVAAQLNAIGEPVRVRTAAGWEQVIAGPYQSRASGQDAQQRIAQAGFTGSQLAPVAR